MSGRRGDGGKPNGGPAAGPHDPTIRFAGRQLKEYERQREEEADTAPRQHVVASEAETGRVEEAQVDRVAAELPETVGLTADEVASAQADPTTEKRLEAETAEGAFVSDPPVSEPAMELEAEDLEFVEEGEDAEPSEPQLWYCYVGDRVEGPYDPTALGQMLRGGVVDHATLLSGQDGTWVPLGNVLEMEPLLREPGATAAPGAGPASAAPTGRRRHDPTAMLPPVASTDLPDRIGRRTAPIVLEEERRLCYEVERILGDTRLTVFEWPASRPLRFLELVGWGRSGDRSAREREASPVFTAGDGGPVLLLWPWLTGELSQIGTHPVPLDDLRADEAVQGIVAEGGDQIPALRFAPGDELVLDASGMSIRVRLGRVRRRPDLRRPLFSPSQLLVTGLGSLAFVVLWLLLDRMVVPDLGRYQPLEPHREMLVRFMGPQEAAKANRWLREQELGGGPEGGDHPLPARDDAPQATTTRRGIRPAIRRSVGGGRREPPGVLIAPPSARQVSSSNSCLSKAAVKEVMRRAGSRLRGCYERAWRDSGAAAAGTRLVLELRITPDGRVRRARLVRDSAGSSDLRACVLGVVRRLRFARARECSAAVRVRYPVVFRVAGSGGL